MRIAVIRLGATILLVAGSLWGAAGQSEPSGPVREAFERGERALGGGDLTGAETAFRQALALDPGLVGAHANLGVVYMRRKEWTKALSELETARRGAPQVAGIRLNEGLVYYRQENFTAATPLFESVLGDAPDTKQARHLLGLCYFFAERYADATATLAPLWPDESANLAYLYVTIIAAGKAGRHDLEEKAARRMLEVGEDSAELHLFIGKAYLARYDDDDAIAELEQAARRNPKLPFVHYSLGIAYRRRQQFEHAKTEFLADAAVEPEVPHNYDQLGVVCYYLEQDREAERYFREALRRDPRMTSSHFGLAKIYKQQAKLPEALAELEAAERLDPESASIRYLKAQVLQQMGRKQEAKSELEAAARLRKRTADRVEGRMSGQSPAEIGLSPAP
jgi:tetratricopeptide (TPR) repeat protein